MRYDVWEPFTYLMDVRDMHVDGLRVDDLQERVRARLVRARPLRLDNNRVYTGTDSTEVHGQPGPRRRAAWSA